MNIEILLFGQLSELTGSRKEMVLMQEGSRLFDLIEQLSRKYKPAFREKLNHTETLRILINGREYNLLDGIDTRLKDKDTIAFLPPIDGG